MILTIKYSCGEIKTRTVKECSIENRVSYFDAMLGGTSKNSKGEYVVITGITYGDMEKSVQ